jgi:steroid delta-isomerase-like uncharacterized protein
MHRVVLLVVTLVLAGAGWVASPQASAQEATPAASCPTTSEDENEAMARRWYEDAYNGDDVSVLDEILSPDVVYHSGSLTQDIDGIKEVTFAPVLSGFPDLEYTIDEVIRQDEFVVLIWHAEGTQTGEFQGFPPSGKHATWTGINVMRFACGRVVEVWAQFNALGRLQQIGAIATPAP